MADALSREVMPLEMTSALAMAAGTNPQVAFAQERIRQAWAQYKAAKVLWLPSVRAGVNYYKHEGRLQDVRGPVQEISRAGFYTGLGARAVGAANPAVPGIYAEFGLTDAIHQPKIASCLTAAQEHSARATRNDILLQTSLTYLQLLEAWQTKALAEETRGNAQSLADLTKSFAKSGQGPQADADRAATELTLRRNRVQQAEEDIRVSSARLAQLLRLDPTIVVLPQEETLFPMDLTTVGMDSHHLVSQGLQMRPELAESKALVCAAVQQLKREKHAPLLPSLLLGVSEGGFGGGTGSAIDNFGDRLDAEVVAWWEVRNLGFGEKAARQEAASRVRQANLEQVRVMDQIAREVVEAAAQIDARGRQIKVAQQGVQDAEASYNRNLARIKDGQGLPIEVLQSLQALDDARREYVRTVVQYNQAQFRLQHATGWPTGV